MTTTRSQGQRRRGLWVLRKRDLRECAAKEDDCECCGDHGKGAFETTDGAIGGAVTAKRAAEAGAALLEEDDHDEQNGAKYLKNAEGGHISQSTGIAKRGVMPHPKTISLVGVVCQ